MAENQEGQVRKGKKSVALSGTAAGNTAICTVGRSGNDLHYRGYDILDFAETAEFEEIAYLLVHGELPTPAELNAYKSKLRSLRGLYVDVGIYDQYHIQYGTRRFVDALTAHGIAHRYEEFDGSHSAIDWRLDHSLPFLTAALKMTGEGST